MVLFIMLYKVVLTFESVDEILKGDHSIESYGAVFPLVFFIMLCKFAVISAKKQKNPFRAICVRSFEVSIFLKSSYLKICLF